MSKHLLFLLSVTLLFSCTSKKERSGDTYFGGEIVNPKTKHIVLLKDGAVIDSIALKEDNTFSYKFKNPVSGIYTFQHNEFQMFYMQPGDSLMVRVNTMGFDESLHYSGIGAKNNNFLMELFLQNEAEVKLVSNYYQLTPTEFSSKIDSLHTVHKTELKKFIKKNNPTEDFIEIAESNLKYNEYIKKELYTSVFTRNPERVANAKFPKEFYTYRKTLDLGNTSLRSYYPYFRFLDLYFDNLTYPTYDKEASRDRLSYIHNSNKIMVMDSLITNDSLKNSLIRRNARRYLLATKDPENGRKMIKILKKYDANPKHHIELETLAQATMKLTPGQKVPDVVLVNSENEAKQLRSVLSKRTVLYFWSMESIKHFKDIHAKVAELSSKYPEFEFIGINTDTHYKKWLNTLTVSGFNKAKEYQIEDIQNAERRLVLYSNSKALIIDKDGVILESNTNIFHSSIEDQLLAFLNL
ncbi:TlpA family protein disulfide reductase [Rasiella sp. SM2506]|uniref:TlpA family protein disulfide reductase n=1 Tax=Rasiella sp. SM2506 TaxID=3423914 RepID=UPI003D7A3C80